MTTTLRNSLNSDGDHTFKRFYFDIVDDTVLYNFRI